MRSCKERSGLEKKFPFAKRGACHALICCEGGRRKGEASSTCLCAVLAFAQTNHGLFRDHERCESTDFHLRDLWSDTKLDSF